MTGSGAMGGARHAGPEKSSGMRTLRWLRCRVTRRRAPAPVTTARSMRIVPLDEDGAPIFDKAYMSSGTVTVSWEPERKRWWYFK